MSPSIIAIIMLLGIPLLIIIGIIAIVLAAILKQSGGEAGQLTDDETKLLQEIHRGLEKMESRVDALEAILVEPQKGRDNG